MRITNSQVFSNYSRDYEKSRAMIDKLTKQISSGKKIQNGYEDSTIFLNTMRLNCEEVTLNQTEESSTQAMFFANNTDNVIGQFSTALDTFKSKLIMAGNGINTQTGLEAIALDLEGLRDNMHSLANTSVNGQYLFSGSALSVKPVNADGTYNGNDGSMKAVVGAGIELAYNVDGDSFFLGKDSDYNKTISTNERFYNQSKLHPCIMTNPDSDQVGEEVYITQSDSIRDMIGDNDEISTGDIAHFYVSGRKSDGTTFQEHITMDDTSVPISDFLEKIGEAYGNNTSNKLVDVSLSEYGQIEIKDLSTGENKLDFHIIGAIDRDVAGADLANQNDIHDLLSQPNVDIIEFIESDFDSARVVDSVSSTLDPYLDSKYEIKGRLVNSDRSEVVGSDTLQSLMGSNVTNIQFGTGADTDTDGNLINGATGTANLAVNAGTTVNDLLTFIEATYGNVEASLEDGNIVLGDTGASPVGNLQLNMTAQDTVGPITTVNAFGLKDGFVNTGTYFEKAGDHLTSNISQIEKATNTFATELTKISDVAGTSNIDALDMRISGLNIYGNELDARIFVDGADNNEVKFTVGSNTYNVLNADGTETIEDSTLSPESHDFTYKQLLDVISMTVSNNLPVDADAIPDGIQLDEYTAAISTANSKLDVGLDYKGRITIKDKENSASKIEFSLRDTQENDFSAGNTPVALSFNANNAIVADEPYVDFFKDLDEMIAAVRNGTYRMDANGDDPRNIGLQNSIERIDHISDHVSKMRTKIGSLSNALSYAKDRSAILGLHVQELESEFADVDIGEALMQFNQASVSFQGILTTISKINSMSLINYM